MSTKFRLIVAMAAASAAIVSAATTAGAQASPTIGVGENSELGSFLVGPNGHTLYIFTNDSPGESTCFNACEGNWPPLTVAAGTEPTAAAGVDGTLGIFERPDGSRQVTLDGQPLYYWAADGAPGDAGGQGIGGVWFVVQAQATTNTATPAPTTAAGTPGAPQSGTGLATRQAAAGNAIPPSLFVALAGALLLFGGATVLAFRRR